MKPLRPTLLLRQLNLYMKGVSSQKDWYPKAGSGYESLGIVCFCVAGFGTPAGTFSP